MFYHTSHTYAQQSDVFPPSNIEDREIYLINPFTNKEEATIIPDDYQLVTDFAAFKKEMMDFVKELNEGNKTGINKPMILDRLDEKGQIIKGRPSISMDMDSLVEEILQHSFTGGKIKIPLLYGESGYLPSDGPHLNEVAIASYTTYFNAHKSGRSKNIELSAMAINGVIVGERDLFSFNTVVGPREVATGYQVAPEIIRGKLVLGIGGGICQTSSTLFNALDQLNVKILERHHHSKEVGYVPKGRDATVSFGGLDFRFQNDTGIPIMIRTYYQKGAITVQIKTSAEYAEILRNEL